MEEREEVKHILDEPFKERKNAIHKCYRAAKYLGYKVFALQDDGSCHSSIDAEKTYNTYGKGHRCKGEGKGAYMAINAYQITSSQSGNFFGTTSLVASLVV